MNCLDLDGIAIQHIFILFNGNKLNIYLYLLSLHINDSSAAGSLVADDVVGVVPLLLRLAVPALAADLVTGVHLTLGTPNMAWGCKMRAIVVLLTAHRPFFMSMSHPPPAFYTLTPLSPSSAICTPAVPAGCRSQPSLAMASISSRRCLSSLTNQRRVL